MNKIQRFLRDIEWLSKVTGSRSLALFHLLNFKLSKSYVAKGHWGKNTFYFRQMDFSAIREILLAEEYGFLAPAIKSKPDFTILDCGSHIGLPIIWALNLNPNVKALSVEASPRTFELLKKNNSGVSKDWNITHRACWSGDGEISFADEGESMGHHVSKTGGTTVKTISLSDLMDRFLNGQTLDLMKVDIEGAEEEFLCTQPELFEKIDSLVIELHPKRCDTNKVKAYIEKYYSKVEEMHQDPASKPLLYCRKI